MAPTKKADKEKSWKGGTHPPPNKNKKYSNERLQAILKAVQSGRLQLSVAEEFGVLQSTLHDKVRGISKKTVSMKGAATVLGDEVEYLDACKV